MKQILLKLCIFAQTRNIEKAQIKKRYDPHGMKGEIIYNMEFFKAQCPKRKVLDEYLKSLPQETLEYIAAVTYGGREYITNMKVIPLEELIEAMRGDEHLAEWIGEITQLPVYVRKGMEIYKI